MDNKSKGIAWVGNMYQKFEAFCFEVDDVVCQEGLNYVENQLETVGANLRQFCSDFVRDVISPSSVNIEKGEDSDSSVVQNTDIACKMSEECSDKGHFEKESCNVSCLLQSCSKEPIKVTGCDLSLEETVDTRLYEKSEVVIKENNSKENQSHLEMSDTSTSPEKHPSMSVSSPAADALLGSSSFMKDVPSSFSVSIVDSLESDVLDIQLTSGDALDELIVFVDDTVNSIMSLGSSDMVKLDESCIILDSRELPSVSNGAGKCTFNKKKFKDASTTKRTAKQDNDQQATWYGVPDLGLSQQNGDGLASSSITTSNHELCESDWEII